MCRECDLWDLSDDVADYADDYVSDKSPKIPKVKTSSYAPRHKLLAKNIKEELKKFEASDDYNPQFEYKISQKTIKDMFKKKIHEQQQDKLPEAIGILEAAIERYGEGNVLEGNLPEKGSEDDIEWSLEQTSAYLNDYMAKTRVDSYCEIKFADMHNSGTFINRKSVSYARFKCTDEYFDKSNTSASKHYLYVSTRLPRNPVRLRSFAVHEIGTHLVRRINEEVQPWNFGRSRFKLRRPGETRADTQTEEGFATINDTLVTPGQLLTQHAVTYFVSAKAKEHSFRELFNMLEKYVSDPDRRWKFCVNAKRGLKDTSEPGGDGKAQCYFEGAVNILQNIISIDIALLFCGKIAMDEHDRVKRVVRRDGLTLPPFAENIEYYRYRLLLMAKKNRLIPTVPGHFKPKPVVQPIICRNPLYHYSTPIKLLKESRPKTPKATPTAAGSPLSALRNLRPSTAGNARVLKRQKKAEESVRKKGAEIRKKQADLRKSTIRKSRRFRKGGFRKKKNNCSSKMGKRTGDDGAVLYNKSSNRAKDSVVSPKPSSNNSKKSNETQMVTRKPLYQPRPKLNSSLNRQIEHSVETLSKLYPTMKFSGEQGQTKNLPMILKSGSVTPATLQSKSLSP